MKEQLFLPKKLIELSKKIEKLKKERKVKKTLFQKIISSFFS